MLTPYSAPGSSFKGASRSLGRLGQQKEQRAGREAREARLGRQQDFIEGEAEMRHEQEFNQEADAAMQELVGALETPNDVNRLWAAMQKAERYGIDISGFEDALPEGFEMLDGEMPAEQPGVGPARSPYGRTRFPAVGARHGSAG
jgi:hypothetical protein